MNANGGYSLMAKGTIAKEKAIKIIKEAFGQNYLGEIDKKLYINAEEDGETVQIAISMTCPKNPVIFGQEKEIEKEIEVKETSNEISEQERENVAELLKRLGL